MAGGWKEGGGWRVGGWAGGWAGGWSWRVAGGRLLWWVAGGRVAGAPEILPLTPKPQTLNPNCGPLTPLCAITCRGCREMPGFRQEALESLEGGGGEEGV